MQSKLRLLHLSDLLRSAAARGSSCLKLKSCSQSFLGEDDCQRLQWLVGCSAPQLLPATVFIKFITSQPESNLERNKKDTYKHTDNFFLFWKQFSQSSSHSQTNLERKRQKQRKKGKKHLLAAEIQYLYWYYQFVFVFVLSICICICRCS